MLVFKMLFHIFATVKKMLYKIVYKKNVYFGKNFTFRKNFSISIEGLGKIIIGNDCFFNNGCSLNSKASIVIGNGVIFGENVKIYG